jgi:carboxypeptidase Taq
MVARVADDGPHAPALPVAGPPETQLHVALQLACELGYDVERGRQDLAPHPFAIRMAHGDVRITTRVDPADLAEALFSTLHEAGHALYEQGIAEALEGTPLANGVSAGVHESQSRLWENLVGRSRPYLDHALPILQRAFPSLADLDPAAAFRAVNRVRPSLIRTEADELTYNLHVFIRFELELALLDGRLHVEALPAAWASRYRRLLGVEPEGHVDGVLQDVHWFSGLVGGAFQGYAIGNVLSVQIRDAAEASLGDLEARFAAGSFEPLHAWLREHLYAFGRRRTPAASIEQLTGAPLTLEPYLRYLHGKFVDSAAGAPMAT